MRLRTLGRDTLIYGLSTLLVRGLQILLIPIYTRYLGLSEYGMVEVVAICGALVNLTVALEISQGMARYIAEASEREVRRSYASTALAFSAIAYGLFVVICAGAASPISHWLFEGQLDQHTLLIAFGALAINGIFVLIQDLLRWELRPGAYLTAGLAYAIGSAGLGIYLVAFLEVGVIGVFLGQLAGALLGGLVAAFGAAGLLGWDFDRARLWQMLRYSAPLVISGIAVFSNLFVDRIVVRQLLGIDALGVYGVAARIASVIPIVTVGLQSALMPLVYKHYRERSTSELLGRVFRFYCVCMVALAGSISLFSSEILLGLTGTNFHASREVLPLLAMSAVLAIMYIFTPGLFIAQRTGLVALINISAATFNLLLCLILVPRLGLLGAGLSSVLSSLVAFTGFFLLGKRYYDVPLQAIYSGISLMLMACLALAGLKWNEQPPQWNPDVMVAKMLVLALVVLAAMWFGTNREDKVHLLGGLLRITSRHKEEG